MLDLRKTVEETVMNEQVIPDLVNYNFSVGKYPKFRFQPMDQPEKLELGKLWLDAVKGKAVHPDAEDELHLRRLIEFPERDRDELEDEIEDDKLMPSIPDISTEDDDLGDLHGDKPLRVVNQRYAKWHRPLTKFEKRVDFAGVEKNLNRLEDEVRVRLKGILEKQRDKLLARIEKATNDKKIDMNWVNALNPQYGVEFQAVVKEFMRSVFEVGRSDARREIDKARRKKHQAYIIKMPPKEVIGMLEKSSFWIRNVTFDGITKQTQGLLLNMLETGETPGETLMYDPYVGDVQRIIDQRQIEPYRIETLIRTNSTKAYNRAKVVEFADPELDGFVRAVQLSAILDTRTTDICRNADGKIVLLDDTNNVGRLTPPLHHQCRTITVPVTEVDGPFEPSKQLELDVLKQQMPPEFGGNFDKGGGWAREDILKDLPPGTVKVGPGGRILGVWSGEGYQVNQVSKARYEIEFDEALREDYQAALRGVANDVKHGERGGRIQIVDLGPGDEWTGFSSTYPEFMVNKGKHWEAKRIVPALEKASEGKSLGQLEMNFVEDAVDAINYEKERMGWLSELTAKEASLIDEAEDEVRRLTKEAMGEATTSKEALRELDDFFDDVGKVSR
jgi:SPP1 gp7 family putative phage head morphogenesis protein